MAGANGNIYYCSAHETSLTQFSGQISSSRLFNLHQVARNLPSGRAESHKPFFSQPILNRAIVLKRNLKRGEEGRFGVRKIGATKVILPLDFNDLGLGGQYFIVGEGDFIKMMTSYFDYRDYDLERDVKILTIMDSLPTFDPFLLYQVVEHNHFDIARYYFQMSQADIHRMTRLVRAEVEPLVRLSLGDAYASPEASERLSGLMISNRDEDPQLGLLRDTLHMSKQKFSQAMFSWKALMFYKLQLNALEPDLKTAAFGIRAVWPRGRIDTQYARYVERAKDAICAAAGQAFREAKEVVAQYDAAYSAMVNGAQPVQFRRLLLESEHRYLFLGLCIARLDQIARYWKTLAPAHKAPPPIDEMCAALVELDHSLCTDLSLPDVRDLTFNMQPQLFLRGEASEPRLAQVA
jgi:hypothetical protein